MSETPGEPVPEVEADEVPASHFAGGCLHVAAVPIGNLGDASPRLRALLGSADLVVAENAPATRQLARLLGVTLRGQVVTSHDGNETQVAGQLAEAVAAGQVVALVAEAGTPGISDPGFRLVRACRALGLPVSPVPGPCAAVSALCASGLPSDRFAFVGFAPPKHAARQKFLTEWCALPATIVGYESPYRIESFLEDVLATVGPERTIAVAREVTKKFETFHVGPAAAVQAAVLKSSRKGEFTWLIAKAGYSLRG